MADKFSNNRDQNEKNKFSADSDGNTVVNVQDNSNSPKDPNGNTVPNNASGYIDAGSTTTPLLNGEEFDTGVMDIGTYPYVGSEVFADTTGTGVATWYADAAGTIPLRVFPIPYNNAGVLTFVGADRVSRYLRVVYTNDSGTDQTAFFFKFRVQTEPFSGQLIEVESFLPSNALATVNRSVIAGKDNSGIYQNVRVNEFGVLNSSDILFDVARGDFDGVRSFNKLGRNPDIDTANGPEDIWEGGGIYPGLPAWGTPSETVEIFSSSALDSSAGTGARTVYMVGLNDDMVFQNYTVTLNGTTPVTIPGLTWPRLWYARVESAGNLGSNQGTITIRATTTTSRVFVQMQPNTNQTDIGVTTVTAGVTRLIYGASCKITRASGAAGSANVRLLIRPPGGVFRSLINTDISTSTGYKMTRDTYLSLQPGTDIKWQVVEVSDNNTIASCEIPHIDFED